MKNPSAFSFLFIFAFSFFFVPTLADAKSGSMDVLGYDVDFEIENGEVLDIYLDVDFVQLMIEFVSVDDGFVELTFPRGLIDAKVSQNEDDIFFVFVDGFETEYIEIESESSSRTIIIPFFEGDDHIEILGTEVLTDIVPEPKEKEPPKKEPVIIEPEIDPEPSDTEIPEWVKNTAGWWAEGNIEDSDFVSGIEFLISKKIIIIPITQSGQSTGEEIPVWVKNTAGWWANGDIGDSDFVSGIQFLISKGIMRV